MSTWLRPPQVARCAGDAPIMLTDAACRQAKALQEGLINILSRIEAVKEEHDKLNNNNKFLQKYIGDLMSTSKITASGSRGKK